MTLPFYYNGPKKKTHKAVNLFKDGEVKQCRWKIEEYKQKLAQHLEQGWKRG